MEPADEFTVISPATGEKAATYPLMSGRDVDRAVKKARALFPVWSRTPFKKRREIFLKAASILAGGAETYAARISKDVRRAMKASPRCQ